MCAYTRLKMEAKILKSVLLSKDRTLTHGADEAGVIVTTEQVFILFQIGE